MSSSRATKRRKLDDEDAHPQHESSPALSKRTPITYGKQAQSSPAVKTNGINATEMWRQAQAEKGRKFGTRAGKKVDVYDDIEGANAGHYPYGRLDEGKRRPQKRGAVAPDATPQKRRTLDPLMNQKSQESVTPKKTAANGLGIFKQFSKDKAPAVEVNGIKKKTATGGRKASATHTDESGSEDEEEEEQDSSRKSKLPGVGSMRGYVYAKPKKTYEDEIRELEEQAKKGAAEKESEDELASTAETPRPSARKASQRISSARSQPESKEQASSRRATKRPLDRRKAKSPSPALVEEDIIHDHAHEPEIAESEDERVKKRDLALPDTIEEVPHLSTPKKGAARSFKKATTSDNVSFDPDQLSVIQKAVLEKTTGKRPIQLTNLADEYAKVYSVIDQTVTAGESNSMLLIGARGSGKTALINQILQEQASKHPDDFHAIRLNGFIHTDDKIALREIWRQLGREMELEEEESTSKSYADTMSKLLALLSHPAEMGVGVDEQVGQITKSVIFVLDEFELFAGHPRQTLLYNLFDIAQSRKAPIAVLGLTTRIDVAESLEKRVKSRFSHRYVHLSLSKSYQAFEQVCRRSLELTTEELSEDELRSLGKATNVDEDVDISELPLALVQWSALVSRVLSSPKVSGFLRRLYYTTKSVPEFLSAATLAMSTLPTSATATGASLLDHISTSMASTSIQAPDSRLNLLATLSTLQLALLICAARLTNIYSTEIISFALVYEEYKVLASKAKLQASASGALAQGAGNRVWSKDVARGAWEELSECGLVMIQNGGTGRVDIGLEEIGGSGVELGMWGRWCKEI